MQGLLGIFVLSTQGTIRVLDIDRRASTPELIFQISTQWRLAEADNCAAVLFEINADVCTVLWLLTLARLC